MDGQTRPVVGGVSCRFGGSLALASPAFVRSGAVCVVVGLKHLWIRVVVLWISCLLSRSMFSRHKSSG